MPLFSVWVTKVNVAIHSMFWLRWIESQCTIEFDGRCRRRRCSTGGGSRRRRGRRRRWRRPSRRSFDDGALHHDDTCDRGRGGRRSIRRRRQIWSPRLLLHSFLLVERIRNRNEQINRPHIPELIGNRCARHIFEDDVIPRLQILSSARFVGTEEEKKRRGRTHRWG